MVAEVVAESSLWAGGGNFPSPTASTLLNCQLPSSTVVVYLEPSSGPPLLLAKTVVLAALLDATACDAREHALSPLDPDGPPEMLMGSLKGGPYLGPNLAQESGPRPLQEKNPGPN